MAWQRHTWNLSPYCQRGTIWWCNLLYLWMMIMWCYTTGNIEGDESNKTKYKREIEKENKAHVKLCKMLFGNGLLDILQLETKVTSNLLCLQCIMEKKRDDKGTEGDITTECDIIVNTVHRSFACMLTVECVCKHHIFLVELERIPQQCSVGDDAKETTNLQIESLINTIQDNTLVLCLKCHCNVPLWCNGQGWEQHCDGQCQ